MKSLTAAVFLLMGMTSLYAQNSDSSRTDKKIKPWFIERFKLSAGFFYAVNNTNVQVSATGHAAGSEIDFEKDLGFNKGVGTFLANFQWRISSRSRINLNYYNIRRSSTHTLQKDINFDSTTYHVNATVNSFFNTAIYQFSYGYAILSKPRYEAGLLIGTHTVGAKAGISLNGVSAGASASNDFDFTAPLPDLGIWGGYIITDRLAVNLDADYLSLTVGDITGSLFAYNLLFTYKLIDQLDLSLGYSGLNFKVDATKKNISGHFKWGYNGPSLAATFNFGKKSWTH
jgi:hypothetical protein